MAMLRSLLVLITLGLLSGCGPTEVTLDGAAGDASVAPTGVLSLVSEPVLALNFGGEAEVAVRYTEGGRPVSGVEVRFALSGRAQSSTVSDLSLVTDADGMARTTVTAGEIAVVFRVRVAAERASPVYVDVSVGDMGFGGLVVRAVYEGGRSEAARRVISVYSGTECDPADGYPREADRVAVLDAEDETQAAWSALPAGLVYTVVGTVEGPLGAPLAAGCVDGVEIVPDEDTLVDLSFSDARLMPTGDYEAELELAATGVASGVVEESVDAGAAVVGGDGAGLYLDALEEELRDRGATAAAAMLAAERVTGTPDASLRMRLEDAGEGPVNGLDQLVVRLAERLGVLRLVGELQIRDADGALEATWSPRALEIGAMTVPDGPAPIVVDSDAWTFEPMPTLTLSWESGDALALESLDFALPVGSLVVTAVSAAGMGSGGAAMIEGAGCGVLAAWVSESATLGPVCDASCAEAACTRALDRISEAFAAALVTRDGARASVSLGGVLDLGDDNGDLMVDEIESDELTGSWTGASTGDPVTGRLVADRMVE